MGNQNQNLQQVSEQIKQTLDRIAQAKDNPQQVQQLVTDAKQKIDQLTQQMAD